MRFKHKNILAVLLMISLFISNFAGTFTLHLQAESKTPISVTVSNIWNAEFVKNDAGIYTPYISLNESNSQNTALTFPSYNAVMDAIEAREGTEEIPHISRQQCSSYLEIENGETYMYHEATYLEFPNYYSYFPKNFMSSNATNNSIKELKIEESSTDITLDTSCFANMEALETVNIKARSVTLKGSVFANCVNLREITITTTNGGSISFEGTGNCFNSCGNLTKVELKGSIHFSGSAAEFTNSTFKNTTQNQNPKVIFDGPVTNEGTVFEGSGLTNNGYDIDSVNFVQAGSQLSAKFFNNYSAQNINFEAKSILRKDAFHGNNNSQLGSVSFNAPVTFYNGAFYCEKITNMYFNVEATGKDQNDNFPTLKNNEGDSDNVCMGSCTKLTNLYLNYQNCGPTRTDICKSLEDMSFGDTISTSLNIDNIYFKNPNFKKISNVTYKRCDGGVTNVYGYGGTYMADGSVMYTNFENWAKAINGRYYNYVTAASSTNHFQIDHSVMYTENDAAQTYNFNTFIHVETTYGDPTSAHAILQQDINSDTVYNVPMDLTGNANLDTNFVYRIWKLYNPTMGSPAVVKQYNEKTYVPVTHEKMSLSIGQHEFLLEFGGALYPFTVTVSNNLVTEILSVSNAQIDQQLTLPYGENVTPDMLRVHVKYQNGDEADLPSGAFTIDNSEIKSENQKIIINVPSAEDKVLREEYQVKGILLRSIQAKPASEETNLNLTYGQTVTKDMLRVIGTYSDNTKQVLSADQYTLAEHEICQEKNLLRITTNLDSPTEISTDMIVYGFPDKVTSFEAVCTKNSAPEGSKLLISDVYLQNISYENPSVPVLTEKITDGFQFYVNNKLVDSYTLQEGKNEISISYGNCVMTNILTINGTKSKITKLEAVYLGNANENCKVYENQQVPIEQFAFYAYKEDKEEPDLISDTSNIQLESYEIIAGQQTEIYFNYNGVRSQSPIVVDGLKDGFSEITSVKYIGSNTVGSTLVNTKFEVSIQMLSGMVLNSEDHPEILQALTFYPNTLTTENLNRIKVVYDKYDDKSKDIFILAVGNRDASPSTTLPASSIPSITDPTNTTPSSTPSTDNDMNNRTEQGISQTPAGTANTGNMAPITLSPTNTTDDNAVPQYTGNNDTLSNTGLNVTSPAPTTNGQSADSSASSSDVAQLSAAPVTNSPTIAKGSKFYISNIQYQVLSLKGNTGTVKIIGYKNTGSIQLKAKVTFSNCSFQVVEIGSKAFQYATTVKGTVIIPKSVKKIGAKAFYNCPNLKKLVFNSGISKIDKYAFYGCKKLMDVDLRTANTLKRVGSKAFANAAKGRKFRVKNTQQHLKFRKLFKQAL